MLKGEELGWKLYNWMRTLKNPPFNPNKFGSRGLLNTNLLSEFITPFTPHLKR